MGDVTIETYIFYIQSVILIDKDSFGPETRLSLNTRFKKSGNC